MRKQAQITIKGQVTVSRGGHRAPWRTTRRRLVSERVGHEVCVHYELNLHSAKYSGSGNGGIGSSGKKINTWLRKLPGQ